MMLCSESSQNLRLLSHEHRVFLSQTSLLEMSSHLFRCMHLPPSTMQVLDAVHFSS